MYQVFRLKFGSIQSVCRPVGDFLCYFFGSIATLHVRSDDATAAQFALKLNRTRNQHQISISIYSESSLPQKHITLETYMLPIFEVRTATFNGQMMFTKLLTGTNRIHSFHLLKCSTNLQLLTYSFTDKQIFATYACTT